MKVCIFSRSIPEHSFGGMERHCWTIATGLAERGHTVKLITTRSPKGKKYEEIGLLEVFYIEGTMPGRYSNTWWRKSIELFIKLHTRHRFDMIFSESIGALSCLKARLRGGIDIPIIISLPGTALRDAASKLREGPSLKTIPAVLRLLCHFLRDRRWLRYSDAIITCSQGLSEAVHRELCVPKENIYTVLNGVDIERFRPDLDSSGLRRKMDLSLDLKVVMCANRLVRGKGTHILLKALSILKDEMVRLIIIGEGRFAPRLNRMAKDLGLSSHVIFRYGVDLNKMPEYYILADVFVLPTLLNEGLPIAILEAMACSRPVIASSLGGIPSIIDDGKDGFLVSPNNPFELKSRLELLLGNPDLRRAIGKRAREKIVSRFNQEAMINETINILERYG